MAMTLAALEAAVAADLDDVAQELWTTGQLERAIRKALMRYSEVRPQVVMGTVASAATREYSLSSLTGLVDVLRVEWPWVQGAGMTYPPPYVDFDVLDDRISIALRTATCPKVTDAPLRVTYTKTHTLLGLDGAAGTTVPAEDEETLIVGACAYAAIQRARTVVEAVNPSADTPELWQKWGEARLAEFEAELARLQARKSAKGPGRTTVVAPAGDPRTLGYLRDLLELDLSDVENVVWSSWELDRALRKALQEYSAVRPQEYISTLAAADSREYALTTLNGPLVDVQRVWWPYDAAAPEYPPQWVEFELWDDKTILFVKSDPAPRLGDKPLRIFYTKVHTIEDLDGATASTYGAEDEEILLAGAAGYAAAQRARQAGAESAAKWTRWGDERLRAFKAGLAAIARRIERYHDARVAIQWPDLEAFDDKHEGSKWA